LYHYKPTLRLQFRAGERKCPLDIDFPLFRITDCGLEKHLSLTVLPLPEAEKKIHTFGSHDDLYRDYRCLQGVFRGRKMLWHEKTNTRHVILWPYYTEIYVNYCISY